MIYIKIDGQSPPQNWCKKANKLIDKIKNISDPEKRKDFIEKNERLWKDLRDWLMSLSHKKCWYSEAREIVSLYDVDHFRPKNRAKQLDGTTREGYWWLAFDWRNFRISGQICNRSHNDVNGITRGKRDYFPVKDEKYIAKTPDDDMRDEIIYFLDPTNPLDPLLLTFDEAGRALPAAPKGTWEYDRADITIKYYFLDFPTLEDERKKIWNRCKMKIAQIENVINKGASVSRNNELEVLINELIDMISPEAELSATARTCLRNLGGPIVNNLVSCF